MRRRLAGAVQAMWRHDAERLAEIVVEVATPQQRVDIAALGRDLEEILDTYSNVAIGELSMGDVFRAAADAVSRHRLKLPADLLLLFKAIATIEGVGRQLDPSFKMMAHAGPVVEKLAEQEFRAAALAVRAGDAGRDLLSVARKLPADLAEVARKVRSDSLQIQFVHRNLDYFVREMDRSSNRVSFAIVIGAIVIGSAVVVHAGSGPLAFGYPALGFAGFLIAGVLGIGLALGILRSGRL
jgi:ubiquinone biosynthesis protein